jgi:hypothetical protein
VHQGGHVSAVPGHLAHQARADVGKPLRRHEKDGFQRAVELAVHQRHLELVLEVAHRAEAANQERRADPARVVGDQSFEAVQGDPGVLAHHRAKHLEALGDREQRLLGGVHRDRDDDVVGEREAPPDQVGVAQRRRIEGAGIEGDTVHGASQKVSATSP